MKNPGDPASSHQKNTSPVVVAGDDVTLRWPQDSVQLSASATDDGLPSQTLTYMWQSVLGEVQFDNAAASQTLARFPEPGTYRVRVVASDGVLGGEDFVMVDVLPPGGSVATVNAGEDQVVELPFSAKLAGSVSGDGDVTVTWTMAGGPGSVSFENASSAQTSASFSAPGRYELLLSVSDGESTSSDSVAITVDPAVYPAPDLSDKDPDRGWLRVAPADVGMDAAGLAAAKTYTDRAKGTGLISRRGRLVHSWGNIDERFELKSTTASIGAIALAFAIDDGRAQLSDKAVTHLPTFGTEPKDRNGVPLNDPAQLQTVTLLQLATHTAGFEKTGDFGELLSAPGTVWRYSDGGLNWLADTLTTIYAEDLEQVFVNRVWDELGMRKGDDVQWRMSKRDHNDGLEYREFASGITANVNALARVGLLYLRRGEWANSKRVFSASFVDTVRTPPVESASATVEDPVDFPDANHRYGVLWWTNATGALPNVPRDAYWAWGLGDSLIVVIPSLDLVIARAGPVPTSNAGPRTFGGGDWNGDYSVLAGFLDPIVAAVRE